MLIFGFLFSNCGISQDCFTKLESAFNTKGSFNIYDGMHDVYLSCFEEGNSSCYTGKVNVENGKTISIFNENKHDNTTELMEAKFYNSKKLIPEIINGISEMIYTEDEDKIKVVFINELKRAK